MARCLDELLAVFASVDWWQLHRTALCAYCRLKSTKNALGLAVLGLPIQAVMKSDRK